MRAIHLLGQHPTVFTDSQAAMTRIESDVPMANEIVDLPSRMYGQGNTLTARWAPGHGGATGNEMADAYAKNAAEETAHDGESRKATEQISPAYLKRKAAKKARRQWRNHTTERNR